MASVPDAAATAVRRVMPTLKVPGPHDKVFKAECQYTFDTAESPGGLYVNVATRAAVCERFLATERRKTGGVLYIHQASQRVPKADEEMVTDEVRGPTKLAIGVEGGFASDCPAYDVHTTTTLVVFTAAEDAATVRCVYPFPSAEAEQALPTLAVTVATAVLEHQDNAVTEAASTWGGQDKAAVCRHAEGLQQLPAEGRKISPNPSAWVCSAPGCGKADNLWLNLGTGYTGCGRKNWDGTGGNGHALEHYRGTGGAFPLCVKLGTITAGGGDCYSYAPEEDDAVEDPHLARHLAHWGINIMALTKTEKSMAELEIDLNANYDFSRISESGRDLVACTGPGRVGLDNLGNTCYINAILQMLATVPEFAGVPGEGGPVGGFGDAALSSAVFDTVHGGPAGVPDDLLAQTCKLVGGLGGGRYAASILALAGGSARGTGKSGAASAVEASVTDDNAMALSMAGISSADASAFTHTHAPGVSAPNNGAVGQAIPAGPGGQCGFVVPRVYRSLVGRGHPDFSTSRQQDAPQFLEWLLSLYDRAYAGVRGSGGRSASLSALLPPNPSDLLSFTVESRLACAQSGGVRYATSSERFLRLRVPLDAAVNRAEVDAARASAEAAAEAAAQASSASGPSASKRPRLTGPGGAHLPRYHVPFHACLRSFACASGIEGWLSPATGQLGGAVNTHKLASLPQYLCVVLSRYELAPDWTTRKIDAEVPVPLELDLSAVLPPPLPGHARTYAETSAWDPAPGETFSLLAPRPGGLQAGEVELPSAPPAGVTHAPQATAARGVEPDAELVSSLEAMGFPGGACARAAAAVGNAGMEAAMEWLLTHNEDANFDAPYVAEEALAPAAPAPAPTTSEPDAGVVAMLCDMGGFGPKAATAALKACGGDVERAADWLFSRMGSAELDAIEVGSAAAGAPPPAGSRSEGAPPAADPGATTSQGKYSLLGFVSHMGASPASGHYVAHVRKDAAGRSPAHADADATTLRWHIFNDAKVALSEDTPLEQGYVYLYVRRG